MNKYGYTYKYPRPAVAVDCVVFGLVLDCVEILLIQRKAEPFKYNWALPGGFLNIDEDLETAARRELFEETNIRAEFLEQIGAFGKPNRDPRDRVISIAYYTMIKPDGLKIKAGSDAMDYQWFYIRNLPPLAFDHKEIIEKALNILRKKVETEPFGIELLPYKFKLSQLQNLYEDILNTRIDKRNFRKKLFKHQVVIPAGELSQRSKCRPAQLYRFDFEKYMELKIKGINLIG
ncbi:MAG: NUDIX hydrolase [Verrucomicrobiia bacterium]|jgi:8-oxo-dGTP diphosphatase